jgi:hypothetical protein
MSDALDSFPLKKDVERCNNKRLEEIREPEVLYRAVDTGGIDMYGNFIPTYKIPDLLDRLTLALDIQKLKVGRQKSKMLFVYSDAFQ